MMPVGSELIWSPGSQTELVNLISSARPGITLYTENEQMDSTAIEQAFVTDAKKGVDVAMTYSSSYVTWFNTLVLAEYMLTYIIVKLRFTSNSRPSRSTRTRFT